MQPDKYVMMLTDVLASMLVDVSFSSMTCLRIFRASMRASSSVMLYSYTIQTAPLSQNGAMEHLRLPVTLPDFHISAATDRPA